MADLRITFNRIGRHGGQSGQPAPAPIERALTGEALANSIALYARRFLASTSFEVLLDSEAGRGQILAGFRDAGTFTVEPITPEVSSV
ncbi:hypothetical protein [Streptomyces sp. A1136]|uniref:hypothetical protein n=1 Tax=Streptomyces sp. A1136 TaxID=2563102 RepID=UPI00109EB6E8|nr:hypothetical protein [Streptomyces sp. A1136]THA56141.1 hypothetical protein E6R62_12415 [Streptomyces sp. A1136]